MSIKTAFTLMNILLISAAVYLGGSVFYDIIAWDRLPTESVPGIIHPENDGKPRMARPFSDYSEIIRRRLFKTEAPTQKAKRETVDLEALKPTDLSLRLWGTVAQAGGRGSYAVIEDKKTRSQNLYREGDSIESATVRLILRGKVVLSVSGRDEILEMEEIGSGPAPPARTPSRPVVPRQQTIALDRGVMEAAAGDVNNLIGQVRIRPHFEQGRPAGVTIFGVRSNSFFAKLGLRSGDVLQGVDGESIESVNDVIGLYEKLKSTDAVTVQVKRRGRLRDLQYRIK